MKEKKEQRSEEIVPLDQSVSGSDFDFEKKKEKISEFRLLEIREEKGLESFPPVGPPPSGVNGVSCFLCLFICFQVKRSCWVVSLI